MAYTVAVTYNTPPDVLLTWDPSVDPGFVSYEVWRDTDPSMATEVLLHTELVQLTNSYWDLAPGPGVWYYRIIYWEAGGGSHTSSNVDYVDLNLDDPEAARTTVTDNDVRLRWSGSINVDFDHYSILRDGVEIGTEANIATVFYDDLGLDPTPVGSTGYEYTLDTYYTAHRSGQGLPGQNVGGTVKKAVVPDIYGVAAEAFDDQGRIAITWTADAHGGFVRYIVYRSPDEDVPTYGVPIAYITTQTTTRYIDTPPPGRWWYNIFVELV